ncbi:hypothetical protein [Thalassovita sp.]|uniref:hypothetical protein n=1 Tax=Thalassovita sp. TaxID=1979401 RepID=UPI00288276B6|nr:hypothetical protein [Thalassovita sp.]MDF1803078.1 hypothetical protein [Thalassovita sp.]
MSDVQIEVIQKVRLRFLTASIGGRWRRVRWGAWALYVPGRQLKLLHSVGGLVHCIYHKAPRREAVLSGRLDRPSKVPLESWQAALSKPIMRRVAENYLCLQRLYAAGLGPEPLGLVIVPDYKAWFSRGRTFSAGYRVADINLLPEKTPATEEQVRAAGVIPDFSKAIIREQIRGYASDLNSVRGVMPDGGEDEITALEAQLKQALSQARGA